MTLLLIVAAAHAALVVPRCGAPRMAAMPRMAFPAQAEICGAALVQATLGLDRGIVAAPADVKTIAGAVEAFEVSSTRPESLSEYLSGSWRLVYSSSLAEGGLSSQSLRRFAATLIDAPAARSRSLAIGECSRQYAAKSDGQLVLEEAVRLRARVPWPLPPAPELQITYVCDVSEVDGMAATASAANLKAALKSVGVKVLSSGSPLPAPPPLAPLPAGRLREGLRRVMPPPAARTVQSAEELTVTAACADVHVVRSGLGEVRVYVRQPSDQEERARGNRAAQAAQADGADAPPLLDPVALREVARAREEAEARGAAALAAAEAEAAATLKMAAAETAALSQTLADAEAALKLADEQSTNAKQQAEADFAAAAELAEARLAATQATAAAELAEAMAKAEQEMAAAGAAAETERAALAAAHRERVAQLEAKAQTDVAEAQQALAMAKAQAEETLAEARAAFAAEKQELGQRVQLAEERAAKAKAAAAAAIGDL